MSNHRSLGCIVFILFISFALSQPALAQSGAGACADTSNLQAIMLRETRRFSWYSVFSETRALDSLPTLSNSAIADTAIVIVTDTAICRQALTHYLAVDTTLSVSKVSVTRYGATRYIVTHLPHLGPIFTAEVFDHSWVWKQSIMQ